MICITRCVRRQRRVTPGRTRGGVARYRLARYRVVRYRLVRLVAALIMTMWGTSTVAGVAAATADADIDVGADGDSISVEIGTPPDVIDGDDGSTDGGSDQPPGCIWQVVPAADGGWGVYRTHPDTGVRHIAVQLFCYGAFVAYGWVDVAEPTADDIIESAVAEMTRQLPPPVPVTNPGRVGTEGWALVSAWHPSPMWWCRLKWVPTTER